MRRRITGLVAAASLATGLAAPGVTASAASPVPRAVAAKTCSGRYVKAHVGGHVKCLGSGEYCAKRYHRAYRRYGFKCVRVHGVLRLRST